MTQEHKPYDLAVSEAAEMARKSLVSMGLLDLPVITLDTGTDDVEGVFRRLDEVGSPVVVIGDWRAYQTFDAYDAVMRFAEEHFSRLRHRKYPEGPFVVVMSSPLSEEDK